MLQRWKGCVHEGIQSVVPLSLFIILLDPLGAVFSKYRCFLQGIQLLSESTPAAHHPQNTVVLLVASYLAYDVVWVVTFDRQL